MASLSLDYSQGGGACPFRVTLAQASDLRVFSVVARWNGAGASGSFLACLSIYSSDGVLVSRTRPTQVFAAGDSGVVTYAPFLHNPVEGPAGVPIVPYLKVDIADPDFPFHTWSVLRAGGSPTQLTSDAGLTDRSPVVNADYTLVAFGRESDTTGQPRRIWVMNADGTGQLELTANVGADAATKPFWHPTADTIVFSQRNTGIKTINADGSGLTTIRATSGGDVLEKPKYNRDGTKIAFLRAIGPGLTTYDLRVMDANGSNEIVLEATPFGRLNGSDFSWAHNSDVVAYANSVAGAGARFLKVNADGTGTTTLASGAAGWANALFGRFAWYEDDSALVARGNASHLIKVMADGSGASEIVPTYIQTTNAVPMFFGDRIYFVKTVGAVFTFVSILGDGSDERTEDTGGSDNTIETFP